MKAVINFLSDVRTSPQAFATQLMKQEPGVQEIFILLAVTYIAAMANRNVYHEEVAHIVTWSKEAIKSLDRINHPSV